jgi:TolA-binding protein
MFPLAVVTLLGVAVSPQAEAPSQDRAGKIATINGKVAKINETLQEINKKHADTIDAIDNRIADLRSQGLKDDSPQLEFFLQQRENFTRLQGKFQGVRVKPVNPGK